MKKLTRYSIFILIIFLFSCKSNFNKTSNKQEVNYIPYCLKVYEADSLFLIKNYEKSFAILDSLNKIGILKNMTFNEKLTYLKTKIILNKKTITEKEINNLVVFEGLTLEYIKNDSILHKKIPKNLTDSYVKLREQYLTSVNIDLREQIKQMTILDQKYRSASRTYNESRIQNEIDSFNQLKTIEIFEKYGYPNKYLIGDYGIDKQIVSIETILLHTNDSIRKVYFLPKIYKYIQEGKCKPLIYAQLYDQMLIYKGQEQFFGSYETKKEKTKEDIDIFNKRRRQIGLWNIGYQDWRNKILNY